MTKPIELFRAWFAAAHDTEQLAEAVALATADAAARPSVRMVLLKRVDERGFVFYTNLDSRKGRELAENPQASMCFHWKSQKRQIRIDGSIVPVSREEADEYFATRARDSQIGAWASKQSRPMAGHFEFEAAIARYATKYGFGKVPRPPWWSGFCLVPNRIEFWENRKFRLHMRHIYQKDSAGVWERKEIYP